MKANLAIYTLAPQRMHMDQACGTQLRVTSTTRAAFGQRQRNLPSQHKNFRPPNFNPFVLFHSWLPRQVSGEAMVHLPRHVSTALMTDCTRSLRGAGTTTT